MTDASRIQSTEHRATWLVLATDGPATELEGLTGGTVYVRTVADASTFSSVLINDRPRIAIVTEPPAGPSEFSLLRQEQRRRHQALRTIHLSPASAITQRLGAPEWL